MLDLIDLQELGVEVILKDGSKLSFKASVGIKIIYDLKEQIRNRPDPLDRAELWEAMSWEEGVFENSPTEGRVFSFSRYRNILKSRMNPEERERWIG